MEDCKLHVVQTWKASFVENNQDHCTSKLQAYETWKQVHFYSAPHSHHYTDGQLVRIQGMIQDMHNPEYYISKYTVHNKVTGAKEVRSGKYKDMMKIEMEEEIDCSNTNEDARERQSLFCIPIPAQNKWVLDMHKKNIVLPELKNEAGSRGQKRRLDDDVEDMVVEDGSRIDVDQTPEATTGPQKKKAEAEAPASKTNPQKLTYEDIQKFSYPIKDIEGQSFILKLYDSAETILMNEAVEVVGFLSLDPAISCMTGEEEMASMDGETQAERMQHQPPASLVPRLHVLSIKKLEHCNPLFPSFGFSSEAEQAFKLAEAAVCDLKIIFTPLLLGDNLAVDFLICNLLSKVFLRKDVTNLGHLSVNFHEVPNFKEYVVQFYKILEQLVTKSHYFPLTIEGLNTTPFVPKKDYTTDKLRSGLLQLSQGTVLVFDETKLNVGQLQDMGTRNVLALQGMLTRQEVSYDFQFYTTQFHADLPVIVFSEKKSLVNCDARVPLECDPDAVRVVESSFEAANLYLRKEDVVNRIRAFLTAAQLANYEIPEEIQQKVQEDFVEMRQKDKNFKGEDLHFILNLARLLTLSKGQHVLTANIWKQACDMEGARRERL